MSNTGRYYIVDQKTGRKFCVEPIDNSPHHRIWGDINPATKELEGNYGKKSRGSVTDEESIITKENGFENIVTLPAGENPMDYINKILNGNENTINGDD